MIFLQFPNDSGPIYLETVAGRFPVEPFNTFSNLVFLLLLLYWGSSIYSKPKTHPFLAVVLPVIFLSFIGGTAYHATRNGEIWLLLDWVPIMLLCVALVVYLVFKIVQTSWKRFLLLTLLLGGSFLLRILPLPEALRISLGYIITALTILIPLLWYLIISQWKNVVLVILAFAVFGLAIFFRSIDLKQELFPMGTHWLWHFFGGVAVHLLISYIYRDNLLNLSPSKVFSDD